MRTLVLTLLAVASSGVAQAQTLGLTGVDGRSQQVTADAIAALPHVDVAQTFNGQAHTFSGVALQALLARVGAPTGEALRGPALAQVVRVRARDGYQVVLSLAETDPGLRKSRVIVADQVDGKALSAEEGPLRLVVEDDLRPARSARQIASIEILDLRQESPK